MTPQELLDTLLDCRFYPLDDAFRWTMERRNATAYEPAAAAAAAVRQLRETAAGRMPARVTVRTEFADGTGDVLRIPAAELGALAGQQLLRERRDALLDRIGNLWRGDWTGRSFDGRDGQRWITDATHGTETEMDVLDAELQSRENAL
jgi:hypothetical protein